MLENNDRIGKLEKTMKELSDDLNRPKRKAGSSTSSRQLPSPGADRPMWFGDPF